MSPTAACNTFMVDFVKESSLFSYECVAPETLFFKEV